MDIRDFVNKQEAALKLYRRIYKLLDFVGTTLILYILLFYFNADKVFPLLDSFEVKAGTSYDMLGMSIAFETVSLALIAAFVSVIITFLRHLRNNKAKAITLIEKQYPELNERLRTAYDNHNNLDNLIVSDLLSTVLSITPKVTSSALIIKEKLVFGVVIILLASPTTVYVVENDIRSNFIGAEDIKDVIDKITFTNDDDNKPDDLYEIDGDSSENGDSDNEDLTGETAIIVVEGTEVDLTLPPGTGAGFWNPEEAEEADEDFDQSSPYEISIISSQAYYEELPEGYESVIKSYFEKMAKT
ncbi:MAG: hypothetical protein RBT65_08595 [Methanolobus sp.]|jgi:hypothetical protein|nr:hypothetical protein [Methanolobus sp.]